MGKVLLAKFVRAEATAVTRGERQDALNQPAKIIAEKKLAGRAGISH